MTMTSTTSTTSTAVTRERGIPFTSARRPRLADPSDQPNPVAQHSVEQHREAVGQGQHDGHHDGRLQHERPAGHHSSTPSHQLRNPPIAASLSIEMTECRPTRTTPRTTCLIAGGGPAGMMLALLLARAGVDVTVMEKHADFLRDFRGDTVHASTLRLLDELGLGEAFEKVAAPR